MFILTCCCVPVGVSVSVIVVVVAVVSVGSVLSSSDSSLIELQKCDAGGDVEELLSVSLALLSLHLQVNK